MTREDIAKAYIQSAQGRATRSGVIAFGAGLVLVLVWAVELQNLSDGRLLRALAEQPRYSDLSRRRDAIAAANAAGVQRLEAAGKNSKRSQRLSKYVKSLQAEAGRIQTEARPIQQRIETAKVTFAFPGLPSITVSDAAAALVWLACAAALLHYLAWCRRSVLRLYSRALRILVSEARVDPAVLHDVAGPLPFWIAPLPRGDGDHVSAKLLRSAAGWDRASVRNYLGLGLVQFVAGLVTLHVVYLGVLYSQLNFQISRAELFRNTPVLSITILLGLVFIGIASWWLTPGRVPDTFSFERPSQALGPGRRAMIGMGLGLAAGAIALIAVSPETIRKVFLRARFRRWANRGALSAGFHEVGRKRRIHYARGEGRPKALKSVSDRYIRQVQIDKDQLMRIHLSAVEPWLAAASTQFKTTEDDLTREGIDRELAAARNGQPPTLVWFDYLASKAWKAENLEGIQRAIALLDPLASTTGGQRISAAIDQRRGIWSSRATRLARVRATKSASTKS